MVSRNGKAEVVRNRLGQAVAEVLGMTPLSRWLESLRGRTFGAVYARRTRRGDALGEALEGRFLLSAATDTTIVLPLLPADAPGSLTPLVGQASPTGITPVQMRAAYGIGAISFNGTAGTGAGQTIAIVDAYNDPNIQSDLASFDGYFGLSAPASFTVMSQTGSTTSLPAASSGWITEIALDVEWSHVIAPGASIVLVEANSNSNADLFAAINTARNQPGVSAVTMSWGGGEFPGEGTTYDSYFTTPAGHTGVTFLASTGDNGADVGVSYPAASPNVVAVGGTTLSYNSSGAWLGETGWSGSGGGISADELQPTYQNGVVTQSTTFRTNPDVAFDADPNSGGPVLDTYNNGTAQPWGQWGGTSLSSPCWAGLIAIANQGRVISGLGTLNGISQTLPALYTISASNFHDITSGSNGDSAGPGYDLVTGRGSPIANALIGNLAGIQIANRLSITAMPAVTTVNQTVGASVSVLDSSGAVVTGDQAAVTLSLNNGGTFVASGTSSISVNAVNGVASFGNIAVSTTGSYTLTVAQGTLTSTTPLIVTAATQLAVIQAPLTAAVGTSLTPTVQLALEASNGATVTTGLGVPVTASWSAGGQFAPGSVTIVTSASGIATFSNLIPALAGNFTLSFSAGTLAPAPAPISVGAGASTTTVTSSVASPGIGMPVTFTATVTPNIGAGPSGTVQFQIDGSNVGNPVTLSSDSATYTTSTLSLGSHSIVAVYSGDTNFTAGTSTPFTQNVLPATTAAVMSSNASPVYGQSIIFTATVTPANGTGETGTVQFQIDGTNVGSPVPLSGNTATYAVSTLLGGSHSIVAVYSGDSSFATSTSTPLTQNVATAASSTGWWNTSAVASFNSTNGANPNAGMVMDGSGNFFGTTKAGGTGGYGTVFEIAHGATSITTLASFNSTNGSSPLAGVVLDSAGDLFGTTFYGGNSGYGTVFEIASGATSITTLASFNSANGTYPAAGVVLDSSGDLFGESSGGGASGYGTIFEIVNGGQSIVTLASFNGANGANPRSSMVLDSSGNLFGTTAGSGVNGSYGTVFEVANGSGAITTLASFNIANGATPQANVVMDSSGNLIGTTAGGGAGYGTVFEVASGGGTVTTLASFNYVNGANPAGVILDSSGDLFGTTTGGGAAADGTLFEITHGSGAIASLASFTNNTGANPHGVVLLDSSGNLFGTTYAGGASGYGSVFEASITTLTATGSSSYSQTVTITACVMPNLGVIPTGTIQFQVDGNNVGTPVPLTAAGTATFTTSTLTGGSHSIVAVYSGDGNYTPSTSATFIENVAQVATSTFWSINTLGAFNSTNGDNAQNGVIFDSSGNLFGTTSDGGTVGEGTVFEIAAGTTSITTLATFTGANGAYPSSGLVLDSSGDFFGMASSGGAGGGGTVFEITHGTTTITTLASFNYTNGQNPQGGVALDTSGNLFGTVNVGGANGYGTVFKIAHGTTSITTLAAFNGANGEYPHAGLTLDSTGNLFGTTYNGGANNDGEVFEIVHGTTAITVLTSFNLTNGANPQASVTLDSSGNLFGTTRNGGANNQGTVFEVPNGTSAITTLVSFNSANGQNPEAGVVLDSSGDLFGTTLSGGYNGDGTVFEIAHGSGVITTLESFNITNGAAAQGGVVLDSFGNL